MSAPAGYALANAYEIQSRCERAIKNIEQQINYYGCGGKIAVRLDRVEAFMASDCTRQLLDMIELCKFNLASKDVLVSIEFIRALHTIETEPVTFFIAGEIK